jgi:hypothetical protein
VVNAALELHSRLRELEQGAARLEAQTEQIVTGYPFDIVTRRWLTVPEASLMALAALHVATHGKAEQVETGQFKAALGAFPQVKSSSATHQSSAHKKGYRLAINAPFLWTPSEEYSLDNPIRRYFAGGERNGGRKFTAARAKLARAVARSDEERPVLNKASDSSENVVQSH